MVEKCLGNRGLPWDGLDSKIGRLEANMFDPDGFSCGVGSFRKCLECTNVKRSVKRYNIGSRSGEEQLVNSNDSCGLFGDPQRKRHCPSIKIN